MKEIPNEIQEAAVIDGASNHQTYFKIFLPLLIPGLFTA
jgi:ABC-type glycerol-3-phosphate transport system permease component